MEKIVKVKDLPYTRYDVQDLKKAAEDFKSLAKNAKSAKEIYDGYKLFLDEIEKFGTNASLAYTRYTLNTHDEFYIAEQAYYDEVGPIASAISTEISNVLLDSPFKPELEKLFPETFFPNIECERKSHSAETVSDEQEENAIVTEYSMLMSQISVEFRGEKKPISYVRGFMEDADRNVRKAACEAIGTALGKESEKLDDIYDRLVKVRTKNGQKNGI